MPIRRYINNTLPIVVTRTVLATVDYPTGLPGVVLWNDGRATPYADTAGITPASPYGGRVRRVNQPAPLTGTLLAPSDTARGFAEPNAVNMQTGGNQRLDAPSGMPSLTVGDVTYAGSFVLRDNPPGGANWLLTGYDNAGDINGVILSSNALFNIYVGGVNTLTSIQAPVGAQVSYVCRCGATSFKLSAIVNGVRSDVTVSSPYPTGATLARTIAAASLWLGNPPGYVGQGFHGARSQDVVVSRAITDPEADLLLAFLAANVPAAVAPTAIPLVVVPGDSIARGLNLESNRGDMWAFKALALLNATQPVNLINTAISGSTIANLVTDYSIHVAPLYNAARARNVLVVAAATNNMATLGQDGPTTLAAYYAYCDTALAAGWRIVVCTVLPRTGTGRDATFETARQYFNSALTAQAAGRGYSAVANVAGIAGMGAAGNDANLTYYSDNIHPTIAGNALLEPVYRAAIQAAIAS